MDLIIPAKSLLMRINSSEMALKTALTRYGTASHDIANCNTPGYAQRMPGQKSIAPEGVAISHIARSQNSSTALSNTDLAEEAGEVIGCKHALAANTKAAKVRDRLIGETIDIIA
jgi:flagellar basal body rod protein FlgG